MFLKDFLIKQLGPCSINRFIESANAIITFVKNIQQDNAIVVIVNINHEVIYIILILKSYILFEIKYQSFICNITYNWVFFANLHIRLKDFIHTYFIDFKHIYLNRWLNNVIINVFLSLFEVTMMYKIYIDDI